jgi:hypothetical protein
VARLGAFAVLALVAASCSARDQAAPSTDPATTGARAGPQPSVPEESAEPRQAARLPRRLRAVELEAIHPVALATCQGGKLVRTSCPQLVPTAFYPRSGIFRSGGSGSELLNIESGGEYPSHPARNRPPRMVHLVVYVASQTLPSDVLFAELWPHDEPARAPRNGLMRLPRKRAVYLGRIRWAGKTGELVLAPPFPLGGMNSNHLAFRWRASGREHAVTLHGWEPFLETIGTLRAVVGSIPEPPG